MYDVLVVNKESDDCHKVEEVLNLQYFNILFDPVRIEIFKFIAINGKSNIGEISEHFTQDRSVISRHLMQMFNQKILTRSKVSRFTYYSLNTNGIIRKFEETAEQIRKVVKNS